MINSIELRNWKVHKDTKLSFSKGTNILVGMMGAGKSSILDAISYALFGSFPALRDGRVSKNGTISNRPVQEEEARVTLSFTVDNDNYSVSRSISLNGPSKARLEKNGAHLQSQPDRVTEEVENVLKIDYDLFTRAVYSEQNRLDYFLELRAGERKAEIDRLLGLDKFALASTNTTSLVHRIEDMVEGQRKSIEAFDLKKMEEEAEGLKKELGELVKKGKELNAEAEKLGAELEKSGRELKEAKGKYAMKEELKKTESDLLGRLSVLEREVEKLKKVESEDEIRKAFGEKNAEFERAKKAAKAAIEKEKEAEGVYAKAEAKAEQLSDEIAEMERLRKGYEGKSVEALASKLDAESKRLDELREELARYGSEKSETRKWIGELEKHISKCPVCERVMDDEMRLMLLDGKRLTLKGIDESIAQAEKETNEKSREVEAISKELNELRIAEDKTRSYSKKKEELDSLIEGIKKLEAAKNEAKRRREELGEASNRIAEEVNAQRRILDEVERAKKHVEEIGGIKKRIEEVRKQEESITVSDAEIDRLQNEFTKLSAKESKARAEFEANETYRREKEKQLEGKEKEVETVKEAYNEIKAKKKTVEELVKFKTALEETQLLLRGMLVDSINSVMQEIWPELYPYGDYSSIMLDAASDDYVLMLKVSRNNETAWENVEGIASGGERSIACLAMRVAFALVLVPNLGWLILDEPTHNIDRQGLDRFVNVFNETLPKIVDQIFIITHDEALKQVSSAKIYSLTRDKDAGGSAVVQEL